MSDENNSVRVRLLDRELKVKCPPHKTAELKESASYLNDKMKEIAKEGAVGMDKISMMAALNISYELLELKRQKNQYLDNMQIRIHTIKSKIDQVLNTNPQQTNIPFDESN